MKKAKLKWERGQRNKYFQNAEEEILTRKENRKETSIRGSAENGTGNE